MKTEQEQIDEMAKIIKAEYEEWLDTTGVIPKGTTYYAECIGCAIYSAETLCNAGFGNVSEYKAEIRELKSYLDHQIDATNDAENLASHLQYDLDEARAQLKTQKQAQIDVLNKAKEKLDSAPNGWAYTGYIDDLIEEVENETR